MPLANIVFKLLKALQTKHSDTSIYALSIWLYIFSQKEKNLLLMRVGNASEIQAKTSGCPQHHQAAVAASQTGTYLDHASRSIKRLQLIKDSRKTSSNHKPRSRQS